MLSKYSILDDLRKWGFRSGLKFIKMKKKIVFAVATGFFAVATVFNMNVLSSKSAEDASLESIAVMAQANGEGYWVKCEGYKGTCLIAINGNIPGIRVGGNWPHP